MLKDLNLPLSMNTSKDNLISDFFIPALKNSIKYDRGVGYFSSSWLQVASKGMVKFAENGGKARWIASPILSSEDWEALLTGDNAKHNLILKKFIELSVLDLERSLNEETRNALAWMIADEIISFKLAKPRHKLDNEFHAKVGIFEDEIGDRISFDGSYNDSIHGLQNYESIKIFKSWEYTEQYVLEEVTRFQSIWDNCDPNIEVMEIPEALIKEIIKLRNFHSKPYIKPIKDKLNIPNFLLNLPKPCMPKDLILRDYQNAAIESWFNNYCKGIFQMATGTGKTITALSCILRLLEIEKNLIVIILCPFIHLVEQWEEEARKFCFRPLIIAEKKQNWSLDLYQQLRDFKKGFVNHVVLISTNATFTSGVINDAISDQDLWKRTVIIIDEVHNAGAPKFLNNLPVESEYRLGMSATPMREYDEFGTEKIIKYFSNVVFEFNLDQAIKQGYLTPYYYYPLPVELEEKEFLEFVEITKKLNKFHPDPDKPMNEIMKRLLIKRSRILNNSESKVEWIRKNISEKDNIEFTLFYAGDKIFREVRRILGFEKNFLIHDFTHELNLLERKEILKTFEKGEIKALIAMKCLDEGVDIPPTRVAYFLASSSVLREFIQRRGRILRNFKGKTSATIFDLISIPPATYLKQGKMDVDYPSIRAVMKREFKRMKEFSNLAINRFQSIDKFIPILDSLDLLDL